MSDTKIDRKKYPTVLTIAGSDSIGGAGIQADIKTCSALGAYAMSVITAITAQNTVGVQSFEAVSPHMLEAQLASVINDVRPDAVKIGMLPDEFTVRTVARFIADNSLDNVVVDPVCVSTSGHFLNTPAAAATIAQKLFPLASVITPNVPELEYFTGHKITDAVHFVEATTCLLSHGAGSVIAKCGHFGGDNCANILFYRKENQTLAFRFDSPRVDTPNTHGTGCTLSSAVAALLARGKSLPNAVNSATKWLNGAVRAGADYRIGHGHGSVNHLYTINPYPIDRTTDTDVFSMPFDAELFKGIIFTKRSM